MQHVQPARGACAAAVRGPLACLADPLLPRQEREGGPVGMVVRRLLQGRQDLRTCILRYSSCWLPLEKSRQAHDKAGTGKKNHSVAWVHY